MTSRPKFFDAVNAALIGIISILCILPMPLVLMVSFTDEASIKQFGYQLFPSELSLDAYKLLLFGDDAAVPELHDLDHRNGRRHDPCGHHHVHGRIYAGRQAHPLPQRARIVLFITMVFNTGLVPWYLINLNLGMNNTIWALIIPSLVFNPFNLFLVRNYMSQIPPS